MKFQVTTVESGNNQVDILLKKNIKGWWNSEPISNAFTKKQIQSFVRSNLLI